MQQPADWLERIFRSQIDKLVADERLLKKWVAGERFDGRIPDVRREIAALERSTAAENVKAAWSRIWDLAIGGTYASAMKMLKQERYRGTIVSADVFDEVQWRISSRPKVESHRIRGYPLSGAGVIGTAVDFTVALHATPRSNIS